MAHISQREARRTAKRLGELLRAEDVRRRGWGTDWPGGINIATVTFTPEHQAIVASKTARKLGHAVIVLPEENGTMRFLALPLARHQ